jgi:hypothetical protein
VITRKNFDIIRITDNTCRNYLVIHLSTSVAGATSEDEQPLISERGVFSRLPSIRVLFVWIVVIILVGGAGVGTFLLIGIHLH